MSYPRFIKSRNIKYLKDTSQNIWYSTTSTTFVPVVGNNPIDGLDLTIHADEGDIIEWHFACVFHSATGSRYVDGATIEGGDEINYLSSGTGTAATFGIPGLYAHSGYTLPVSKAASTFHSVVPADLGFGNTVTIRPIWRVGSSTGYINAHIDYPLFISIQNLGPAYPS